MPRIASPDPLKKCHHCSQTMIRKRYGKTLEDMGAFRRRKFCSRICMALAMTRPNPTRWTVQKRVRRFLQTKCESCGTTHRLAIHHRDKNWQNNEPLNLATLCMSCHTSWHHKQGDILTRKLKPPCLVCGKPSYRRSLCSTHRTRLRRSGHPLFIRTERGLSMRPASEFFTLNGRELVELLKAFPIEFPDLKDSETLSCHRSPTES